MNFSSKIDKSVFQNYRGLSLSQKTLNASLKYLKGQTSYDDYVTNIDDKDKEIFRSFLTNKKPKHSIKKTLKKRKRSSIPSFVYDFLDQQQPVLRKISSKPFNQLACRPKSLPRLKQEIAKNPALECKTPKLPKLYYESYKNLHGNGLKFKEKNKGNSSISKANIFKPYTVEISPRSKMTIFSSSPIPRSRSELKGKGHKFLGVCDTSISPRRSLSPDKLFSSIKQNDRTKQVMSRLASNVAYY
ncbi:unnamed protein product [Blepharisma stoltei]|uniref:Uncharacterized protein n=1 Tax=Blepharisma stoltei TaxID=1481888 RepID=A0AAU9IEI0_9CILI|nr:unnamed protein product [Blepharisma stoltei]